MNTNNKAIAIPNRKKFFTLISPFTHLVYIQLAPFISQKTHLFVLYNEYYMIVSGKETVVMNDISLKRTKIVLYIEKWIQKLTFSANISSLCSL